MEDRKKNIILGVTGSIAAYKALTLMRKLLEAGHSVQPILTRSATRFVTPLTFSILSQKRTLVDLWETPHPERVEHVEQSYAADLIVVAPATANFLQKMARGEAEDPLLATLLSSTAPVLIAPAMETHMWRHSQTQASVSLLRARGVHFVEPTTGRLGSGLEGEGRMEEPEAIYNQVLRLLSPKPLKRHKVVVTAGPTREALDAVRYLSNPSTGKMGYCLAEAALDYGAEVHLISGPSALTAPHGVKFTSVNTTHEMYLACKEALPSATLLIMAAAPSDFKVATPLTHKAKKSEAASFNLKLESTEDILLSLQHERAHCFTLGFAAETQHLLTYAQDKLKKKNLDMLVANEVINKDTGFASNDNAGFVLLPGQTPKPIEKTSKKEFSRIILDHVIERLKDTELNT